MAVIIKRLQQQSPTQTNLLYVALAVAIGSGIALLVTGIDNPFLIILAVAALGVLVATVASVEVGLLLFVFTTYTRFSDNAIDFFHAPSVAKFFVALLIIAILIRWAILGVKPEGWLLPAFLLTLYGLVGFMTLLYAINTDTVLYTLSNYVKDALIAVVIVILLKRPMAYRHVIWILIAVAIFLGSLSVYQYLTGTFKDNYGGFARAEYKGITTNDNGYRLVGPIGDANFFAQIMVVLIPIGLERMIHERRLALRIMAGAAAFLSALTVVFTFSRGGFLATSVALLIFFLIYPPRPVQLAIMIGLGMGMLYFVPPSYIARILSLQDLLPDQSGRINVRSDNSFQGRASQDLTAWQIFKENPLVGIGLNNFEFRYIEYSKDIGLAPTASNRSIHNLYFEVLTETGIIGFSVFMTIIGLSLRHLRRARRAFLDMPGYEDYGHLVTGLLVGFIGYLVAAIFIHAAFPRYFYLIVGIAFSMPALVEYAKSSLENRAIQQA